MQELLAIFCGIALSAACGFRVFVPMLTMAVAVHTGQVSPAKGFEWIGSWPAIIMLGTATVTEVVAYYVPWLDHALDTVMTPAAIGAGTVVAAAVLPGDLLPPAIKWAAALIAGGGAAGAVQAGTVVTRAASGATTGGLGNPIVATIEHVASLVLSVLAVIVPILAIALVLILLGGGLMLIRRLARQRRYGSATVAESTI